MKDPRKVILALIHVVTPALYVTGFFVLTETNVSAEHPGAEVMGRRFPSRLLMTFWRPMWLYDRHHCAHWDYRTSAP